MIISAGLLMYRYSDNELEYFLVHPGGPLFANKDAGYWGIPKGIAEEGEDLQAAAKREFEEETGIKPNGKYISLGEVVQKNRKEIHAWAFVGSSGEPPNLVSNQFEMEYPFKSGKKSLFPEIDIGKYFKKDESLIKINNAQANFILRLEKELEKLK